MTVAAELQMYINVVDFLMTNAPLHYTTFSDTAKAESKEFMNSSETEFVESIGPMGLHFAYLDCITIFIAIFS